jgi:hypothetical protein
MSDTFAIVSTTDTPTKGKQMSKIGLFTVSYEGHLLISAENEDLAMDIANKMLSESGIANDESTGEWALTDVEDEDYYTNG